MQPANEGEHLRCGLHTLDAVQDVPERVYRGVFCNEARPEKAAGNAEVSLACVCEWHNQSSARSSTNLQHVSDSISCRVVDAVPGVAPLARPRWNLRARNIASASKLVKVVARRHAEVDQRAHICGENSVVFARVRKRTFDRHGERVWGGEEGGRGD
jgi:hypothetical protein